MQTTVKLGMVCYTNIMLIVLTCKALENFICLSSSLFTYNIKIKKWFAIQLGNKYVNFAYI